MKKFSFLFSLLLVAALMPSCEKEAVEIPTEEVAPKLPPEQTFIMPFNGFEDADTSGYVGKQPPKTKNFGNWFFSVSNIVVWNTVVGVGTAIPVASFRAAFNEEPVHTGDGVWAWVAKYDSAQETFIATLTGQFINNNADVKWEMRVSKVGGFNDMLWYSGVVSENFTKASWTLYHQPFNPEPSLSIDYEFEPIDDTFFIRYTNIIPDSPDNGDYIEYRLNSDGEFNRAYDVFRVQENNFLEIQWNEPIGNGRVKNSIHFQDSEWHCWNDKQRNTDC